MTTSSLKISSVNQIFLHLKTSKSVYQLGNVTVERGESNEGRITNFISIERGKIPCRSYAKRKIRNRDILTEIVMKK